MIDTTAMKRFGINVLAGAACLLAACGQDTPPTDNATPVDGRVQRLSQAVGADWRGLATEPLTVPLDEQWQPSHARLDRSDEGLVVTPDGGVPALFRACDINLDLYTHLRVRVKTSEGKTGTLWWQGPYKPRIEDAPCSTAPLFGDNKWREYAFPLSTPEGGPWRGKLTGFSLCPTDAAASVVIGAVDFVAIPPDGPLRITLGNETREALYGASIRWELTVPPYGVLDASFGLAATPGNATDADGVRFRVELKASGQRPAVLLNETVAASREGESRGWLGREIDLSAYAGQAALLEFKIDSVNSQSADFAFWGDPLVYSRAPRQTGTPVVLISCDTMRADHLSCYGYPRKTTPNLDAFAQDAVLFENAFCSEVWTPTSHMTILTGLYPKNHGLTRFLNLAESVITLPEVLHARGYNTGGFVGHYWWMMPSRGFAHGFDLYDAAYPYRDVYSTLERVLDWLEPRRNAPFFLFFHNYDLHSKEKGPLPYDPEDERYRTFAKEHIALPEFARDAFPDAMGSLFLAAHNNRSISISETEREALLALYDDCLVKVDAAVGEFLEHLRNAGIYERALIIVTADHGEAFGEHDRYMHGDVYEANIHVPLLIKFPGQANAKRRIRDLVELADLFPTILELLGVPLLGAVDGCSLLPLLDGGREPVSRIFSTRAAWRTVRTADSKLIRNIDENRTEYYAITKDSEETQNLYDPGGVECTELAEQLSRFFQPRSEGWHIRFSSGGKNWSGQFSAETNDRIVSVQMLRGHMIEGNMGLSLSNRFQAALHLTAEAPEDTMLLRTAGVNATIGISVTSDQPFLMGDSTEITPAAHGAMVLDPMDARYRQAPRPPAGDMPSVSVWFVPPSAGGGAAEALTPEAQEELRALGYVD